MKSRSSKGSSSRAKSQAQSTLHQMRNNTSRWQRNLSKMKGNPEKAHSDLERAKMEKIKQEKSVTESLDKRRW